jgi:hypothetical protein
MSEQTPQAQTTGAAQVPPQSRGQEQISPTQATGHRMAPPAEPTGWVGMVVFGAMMMIMVGAFQAIAGLTALFNSDYYIVTENNLLINVDYTAWGWVHLAVGVVAVAAGFGLFTGAMWARVLGITVAVLSAIVNFAFMAAYPVWAITMITIDVLVIYAIAAHGRELQQSEM